MIMLDGGNYFCYERIGEFHLKDEWIHPRRTISSFELIAVLEGTLYITEDGVAYELRKNDCLILEPGKVHFGTKKTREPVAFFWLHFTTDIPLPVKALTGAEIYDVKFLLKKLLHNANTPSYSQRELDALAYLIFEEIRHIAAKSASIPPQIGLIKEYVRNNVCDDLTVSSIAEHLKYNPDYLGKLFKKYSGISLKSYITSKKLAYAENLLLSTDMTVKQIAYELGYDDENTFLKFFIYHKKISPKNLKNKYFNTHLNNR